MREWSQADGAADPHLHPARIAAIARAFGAAAPDWTRSRALEVGCGAGWAALSWALDAPEADVVGVAATEAEAEAGRAEAVALGLANARFEVGPRDGRLLARELGEFDYVVAHVRAVEPADTALGRALDVCGAHLAPGGVAALSYPCLPGWRGRQVADELLRFHAGVAGARPVAAAEARGLLSWLADAVSPAEVAYKVNLQRESEWVGAMSDAEIVRGLTGPRPQPVYFAEAVAAAEARGLAYLADADHGWNRGARLPAALAADVARLAAGDVTRFEQYQDFVVGRTARRSVWMRRGAPRVREAWGARVAPMWVASRCERAGRDEVTGAPRWRVGGNARVAASAAEDAMFEALQQAWPGALAVRGLFEAVAARVVTRGDREEAFDGFCEALVGHWAVGLVDVRATPLAGGRCGARPAVRAVARRALARGAEVALSADQVAVRLEEPLRTFATWVDGTLDVAALTGRLREAVASGEVRAPVAEASEAQLDEGLRGAVEAALARLEKLALLAPGE